MAEYINKTNLLADILDEECRSKKEDSLNVLSWFTSFVQRQPVADVVPRAEVLELITTIEENFEIGYGGVYEFKKLLAELKEKYIGE